MRQFSDEHNRKISEYRKGKPSGMLGKHHSQETKKKIGLALKGRKLKPLSKEHREKLRLAHTGVKFSEERKKKISESHKGEKSYSWKGGISPIGKRIRNSFIYKKWRQDIFIRDDFTCKKCGARSGMGKTVYLEAHHKKPFYKFVEEIKKYLPLLNLYDACLIYTPLWNLNNGITLCKNCHNKLRGRLYNAKTD